MKKKFEIRLLYFSIPFIIIFVFNYFVDPFNLNGLFSFNIDKKRVSFFMNSQLYDLIEFRNSPEPNLIIGDSRTYRIETEKVEEATGDKYYNFSYGNGTLAESVHTFWYALKYAKLKNVYFGTTFAFSSAKTNTDRIPAMEKLINFPINYYLNYFVLQASIYNLIFKIYNINYGKETTTLNMQQRWDFEMNAINTNLNTYVWPERQITDLVEIARFCRMNDINMNFIVCPSHMEAQKRVKALGKVHDYNRFMILLRSIATTYNFDTISELTASKNNFTDPVHFKPEVSDYIISKVWDK